MSATVPRWRWVLATPTPQEEISIPAMLRQWHSANRLGLPLRSLEVNGVLVDQRVLDLLNAWIACGGAFNASRQDYFQAWARLDRVLKSDIDAKTLFTKKDKSGIKFH